MKAVYGSELEKISLAVGLLVRTSAARASPAAPVKIVKGHAAPAQATITLRLRLFHAHTHDDALALLQPTDVAEIDCIGKTDEA